MKRYLLLGLLIVSTEIAAQTVDLPESRENPSFLTLDLVTPVLPTRTPRWNVGYVHGLNPDWKIGASIGYGNKAISMTGYPKRDYSLWEIKPEIYYIISPEKNTLHYISLETFFIHHTETLENDVVRLPRGYVSFEQVDYTRRKYGAVFKYGLFIDLTDRWGVNVYSGIGVRTRDNRFSNFVALEDRAYYEEHLNPFHRYAGVRTGFQFSLGVNLFYRFGN